MRIGNREFDLNNKCYIMGILNVTPDSFSDGGKFRELDKALFQVEKMLAEGMDVLDIGGESTRPGHEKISDEEEMERVLPILEKVRAGFDVPISLDTYKPAVAKAGILAGADLINDIRGLKYDTRMAEVIAEAGVCCCLMHNRQDAVYGSFITDVMNDLRESISLAKAAGIAEDKIILDPGIGFGKTREQNLEMIAKLDGLHTLGYPLLLGCSRKSVIGLTLDLPVEERLEGTLVTTVVGVLKGCGFVRVHDVKENLRAVKMAEAIREYSDKSFAGC
ncbi:MAG: dihydropteroate synthase [Lachnospiraceae bacterium]|jgi:dihydropteroate synthase|nr:dihydropteroate synthase [Lachnospiraceae bacterium]